MLLDYMVIQLLLVSGGGGGCSRAAGPCRGVLGQPWLCLRLGVSSTQPLHSDLTLVSLILCFSFLLLFKIFILIYLFGCARFLLWHVNP